MADRIDPIDHAAQAEQLLGADWRDGGVALAQLAEAQVHATLALVEQQRITNEANAEAMREMLAQLSAVAETARQGWEAHNRVSALYEKAMGSQA